MKMTTGWNSDSLNALFPYILPRVDVTKGHNQRRELALKCTERESGGSKVLQSTPTLLSILIWATIILTRNYYQNREKT